MKKKKYVVATILVLIILVAIFFAKYRFKNTNNNDIIDYSLVFDAKYYADTNPDIKELCNDDEEKMFEHFLNYGMLEGRRGSINFYVNYYKENNPDLVNAFGDDLIAYYKHYIQYGYDECRKGSTEDTERHLYKAHLLCELKDDKTLELNLDFKNRKFGENYYLLQMPAYESDVSNAKVISKIGLKKEIDIQKNKITDKYVIAKLNKNGKYETISNFAYIKNPEMACENLDNISVPEVKSKKGLQVSTGVFDDVKNLEPSYIFTNIYLQKLLLMQYEENNTIEYEYEGKTYYFNKFNVQEYDDIISQFTNEGRLVISSILNMKQEGFDILYYPEISMDTGASLYAVNTTNEEGQMDFEAAVDFISNRYNGTNQDCGYVGKWVIGNEVNESGTYNYMGEKNINDYLDEYTRTFRIAYNIIKSNNSNATIYVPEEPFWGIDSVGLTYGGREFINIFNSKIKEGGNIDWGLAYHAYSYPLCDPKALNDDIPLSNDTGEFIKDLVTKNSFYTPMITMKNIDVLTDFMKQKAFLAPDGKVRSIILSEQGYTSNSNVYGECEALQAASIVYAYYKTEMNPEIDAFIYFLQKDDERASLGNEFYRFGLSYYKDENLAKKFAYKVFRDMDKKDSLEKLSEIKDILGISDWNEVIDNFDESIFEKFENSQNDENKIDIANAEIKIIENQKYTGEECLPEVTVKYKGKELTSDVDYDVVYLDNTEIGEATAIIVGMGEFGGIQKVGFVVEE